MKLSQFNFSLTADKIASEPPVWRDECRLMVLHKDSGEIEHKSISGAALWQEREDRG